MIVPVVRRVWINPRSRGCGVRPRPVPTLAGCPKMRMRGNLRVRVRRRVFWEREMVQREYLGFILLRRICGRNLISPLAWSFHPWLAKRMSIEFVPCGATTR